MSTIRPLKGAFTSRLSLWARPSPHIAFRPHVSSHQPLSCARPYSDDQSREWGSLQDFFNDQIEKPKSHGKLHRSKQTKEARSTDDGEDEFSRILSPKQEKPKKPWLKKREESLARRDKDKAEERRRRKTARNIALLEQETSRRHAAGRPDITSAIDPERSEITPRTAKEAIARWQEMKGKDSQFQPKESRAVRALKRDVRREAKEARIFMASQAAEKAWEHEFEQIEKEKKPWNVKERVAKESLEKLKALDKLPREVPAQAQQNAVRTPEDPRENDSPEENPDEWEDELDDDAEWAGKKKPSKIERRRMKLLQRFKEGLQKKMGVPVGDTKPHPEIDAKCDAWLYNRIKAEEDRERRKKTRKAVAHKKFVSKLRRKAKGEE
ncbi:hypothetical protein B0H65DRAFT_519533 [Neurospora tetraspora]|uniref:Uncharacterized protein n=1 Tax=Neurospora tetraspora TaxID=94610 RepID=A0AAE0JKK2_9PEZI|nr:hypothetical protein B0H65DRAFT_519533 [Neurospora tetraspora]